MNKTNALPAGILSLRFLRGYITTMRPYLLFVSGITGIVGLSLAPSISTGTTLLLGLAFFLSYGFGQALTDCFQLDTDALSAPYRPLVRGELRRADVMAVSLAGLLGVGLILALYNRWNIGLAAVAVAGLATYTYFKRRWWAGPFYNAWIVAVLAIIAYLCGVGGSVSGAGDVAGGAGTLAVVGTVGAVFFGYANFVLSGYYKDISADRATGYKTLPVVFGLRVGAVVSDAFALLTAVGCGVTVYATLADGGLAAGHAAAFVFLAAGFAYAGLAQVRLHRVRGEHDAHRAIEPVVHAYILLLAAVAAFQKPDWTHALVLFWIGFVVTMESRPMKEQI
jgi:4-hydroxybenzoate polyprenyltransferase